MLERKEINSVGDEHRTTATPATEMTWCNNSSAGDQIIPSGDNDAAVTSKSDHKIRTVTCPSCGHSIQLENQKGIHDLPGLPAGVKFDPSDQEILEHLEAKSLSDTRKLHPLIDEFIPTIEGENGICYTHPEKLPGVNKDGQVRHFFHRPSRAYMTGTRKRRKVHTDADGGETRWHKTGKTRAVFGEGNLRGYKKILVLYTNYGRQRKPEKTNWVMHQYHLGHDEEEKDGELVVSKVFYQTQPRQCGSSSSSNTKQPLNKMSVTSLSRPSDNNNNFVEYYNPSFISSYHVGSQNPDTQPHHQLIPTLVVHGDTSSFINLSSNSSKDK